MNSRHPGRPRKEKYILKFYLRTHFWDFVVLTLMTLIAILRIFMTLCRRPMTLRWESTKENKKERKKKNTLPRFFLFFVSFFV